MNKNLNILELVISEFDKELPINLLLRVQGDQCLSKLQQILGVNELPEDIKQDFETLKQVEKSGSSDIKKLDTALRKN